MITAPRDEAARAAADLARSVLDPLPESLGAALAAVGLLDADVPAVVAVEVARVAGAVSLRLALPVFSAPVLLAAAVCGAGGAAASLGLAYARTRVVFGRPLASMGLQRQAFASVAAGLEAAMALARRVAAGHGTPLDESSVLPYALDAAWAAAEAALQVHGGYGYTDDYPVSTIWRDVAAARAAFATA